MGGTDLTETKAFTIFENQLVVVIVWSLWHPGVVPRTCRRVRAPHDRSCHHCTLRQSCLRHLISKQVCTCPITRNHLLYLVEINILTMMISEQHRQLGTPLYYHMTVHVASIMTKLRPWPMPAVPDARNNQGSDSVNQSLPQSW